MTGYQSKRAAAQDKMAQDAFYDWWGSDYDDSTNPCIEGTPVYWAWAGWHAALAQSEQEPLAWRELCRRLYVELFHCNAQMTYGQRAKWKAGKEVLDVLADAKTALDDTTPPAAQPAPGDIRALKHHIHELEGEIIGYKRILDAQPAQKPVAWIEKDIQCDDFDPDSVTCEKPDRAADGWEWIPLYITPPQRKLLTIEYQSGYYDGKKAALASLERNFCERCGKRTADLTVIHTCTPPQENT
jgi:hypothetical protein